MVPIFVYIQVQSITRIEYSVYRSMANIFMIFLKLKLNSFILDKSEGHLVIDQLPLHTLHELSELPNLNSDSKWNGQNCGRFVSNQSLASNILEEISV